MAEEFEEEFEQEYTDKDMQMVTQLAYMNFTEEMDGKTIGEIMDNPNSYKQLYSDFMNKYNDDKDST